MIFDRNTLVSLQFIFDMIIKLSLIKSIQLYLHINTDDKDRKSVNPDKLKDGLQDFESDNEKEVLYMFLAKYVRKTHSDSEIKRELKSNEGMSFIDLITPSDIAFVDGFIVTPLSEDTAAPATETSAGLNKK